MTPIIATDNAFDTRFFTTTYPQIDPYRVQPAPRGGNPYRDDFRIGISRSLSAIAGIRLPGHTHSPDPDSDIRHRNPFGFHSAGKQKPNPVEIIG